MLATLIIAMLALLAAIATSVLLEQPTDTITATSPGTGTRIRLLRGR